MNLADSLLRDLVTEYSSLRPQIYFKSSLLALARAMEDLILASDDIPLVIANFQQERFFRSSKGRFDRLAYKTDQIYVLAVPDSESSFAVVNSGYETIPLEPIDTLAQEKCLIIVGQQYTACLVAQEKLSFKELNQAKTYVEQEKRFEGFWTFERHVTKSAANRLLQKIQAYRSDLSEKIAQARKFYLDKNLSGKPLLLTSQSIDLGVFTQRLVTYLQAGQYKLLKAYKAIAVAERRESLINKIAQAQRHSLNPPEILEITAEKLGEIFPQCRCLLYFVNPNDTEVTIKYESVPSTMPSLLGQSWSLVNNPVFIVAQTQDSALVINNVTDNFYLQENLILKEKIKQAAIDAWLMVSIRCQDKLFGVLELHYSGTEKFVWESEDVALVEAVANSAGTALTQASAYINLVELNQQLEAVERIQNNLIAVVGHELRTPLSTIRICLESLASEPDLPIPLRESMLETALSDSERLGQIIQDFLTLSRLEAKRAYRNIELVQIEYVLNLALHRINKSSQIRTVPNIKLKLCDRFSSVLGDAEGLVEVFYKLLDNACKFTPADGEILITTCQYNQPVEINSTAQTMLEVIITDTGRGIERERLEIIFDRFSQSESYLRRSVGGVGLGLVICRQIINVMGGQIWAFSDGKDLGSQFHFTIPIEPSIK